MFKINTQIIGEVAGIKTNKDDKDARLQFLNETENGIEVLEVKIKGAKKNDLERFRGQKVVLNDVNVYQIDYNKFYSVDDITKVKQFSK